MAASEVPIEVGSSPRGECGQMNATGQQHPISCTHCRQRKVKCNKVHPCLPCQRSGFECVFPERAKHPKRKKVDAKTTTQELLDRLSKMEKLIGGIQQDGTEGQRRTQEQRQTVTPPTIPAEDPSRRDSLSEGGFGERSKDGFASPSDGLNRYIGGGFWRSLTSEVEALREAIDDDDEDVDSPYSGVADSHSAIMFGSAFNTSKNLKPLHPVLPAHILSLFELYATNTDPVCKFMHMPSLRTFVGNVVANFDHIPTDNYVEPLLFAIYYSSITTLTHEQCLAQFQDGRDILLSRYRAGFERALTNADFLNTNEIGVLQALTLFLFTVRANDDSQYSWTLLATLVRLAHGMGIHRENMSTGISPFDLEMRRRLWWHIVVLDIRNCEDRASESIIMPTNSDPHKPLNCNDSDLSPDMKFLPPDRIGFTEMSIPKVSHEVSLLRWCFSDALSHYDQFPASGQTMPLNERMQKVNEIEQFLNHHIIQYCDPSVPLQWVTAVVARLIMCRIRLILYHPIDNNPGATRKPERLQVSNDKLLETAVACMEYTHLLDVEPRCAHWRWFFKTYVQWHALATTLAELCLQTKGPIVARAWRIVDIVFDDWAARIADSPTGMLWRPMKKLMSKAQAKRLQTRQLGAALHSNSNLGQQPLPTFDTLAFGDRPPRTQDTGYMSPLEIVKKYGVACMPAFDGTQTDLTGHGAGVDPPLFDSNAGSGSVSGEALGFAPGLQGFHANDIRTGAHSNSLHGHSPGESPGEINWAEWDEFMSCFNIPRDLGAEKDVDMMGMRAIGDQGKGLDVWW